MVDLRIDDLSYYHSYDGKQIDGVTLYTVDEFDYTIFQKAKNCKRSVGNQSGRNKKKVKNIVCSFDIETTGLSDIEHAIMYVWQFAIGTESVIIGRTWSEFRKMCERIVNHLRDNESIKIFVHNLAYEFSFLKGIYHFAPDDVFCLRGRRVAKCVMLDKLVFVCSYMQSNMNLALLTKTYEASHQKLSGEDFNYNVTRYPWTELTDTELSYCINDVIGLNEAMLKRMEVSGDNLYSIPLTSTGYVRRDVKRAMREYPHAALMETMPDYATYKKLRSCFRGGDTHANRFYANKIITDVVSYDRVSSYPDVILNCKFPMGAWYVFDKPCEKWLNIFLEENINALLITCTLHDLRLRDFFYGNPYISTFKCDEVVNGVYDNGRVIKASAIKCVLTDIDCRIIRDVYDFEIEVHEIRFSKYKPLPKELRDVVINYFRMKTELKGIEEKKILYDKYKALLNSIYGLMAQDPVQTSIKYYADDDDQFKEVEQNEREAYEKTRPKLFLSYAFGTWVTAWARWRLYEGIRIAGENFVYCDTDSVKFLRDENVINLFEEYNEKRKADSIENDAYATDIKGHTHYMGIYEHDGSYKEFKTMGAKKYGYVADDGLHITIAGVHKKKGAKELEKLGGLSAMKEDMTFKDGGGLCARYNDRVCFDIVRDGKKIRVTDNVYLEPSEYTLGLTAEYALLLRTIEEYEDYEY